MIEKLKNSNGVWLETREDLGNEICKNLMSTLSSKGPQNLSMIRKVLKPMISKEDNDSLIAIPSGDEIKKVPVPNGGPKISRVGWIQP